MIPLIVVANDSKKNSQFIDDFVKKNKVNKNNIFYISPEKKELTISQIRAIKKEVMYSFSEPLLYILERFDLASYEAQNAFLKTLEEHNTNVNFILLVKNYKHLTQTVLSRSKVIVLDESKKDKSVKKDFPDLKGFVDKKSFKFFASKSFQVKRRSDPNEIFDEMIEFFKARLNADPLAAKILKELIHQRFLAEHNNINPQNAVDHLLIFIWNSYLTS